MSIARRWNGRIASYAIISATKSIGKNRPIEIRIRDRVEYIIKSKLKKCLSESAEEALEFGKVEMFWVDKKRIKGSDTGRIK